jgi:hypothetical protein
MAEKLGLNQAIELLNKTLQEEEEADQKLTEVAGVLYGEVPTGDEEAVEDEEEAPESPRPRMAGASRR